MKYIISFVFSFLCLSLNAQISDTTETKVSKEIEVKSEIPFSDDSVQLVPDGKEKQTTNADTITAQKATSKKTKKESKNNLDQTRKADNTDSKSSSATVKQQTTNSDSTRVDSLSGLIVNVTKSIDSLASHISKFEEYVIESKENKGFIGYYICAIVILLFVFYVAYKNRIAIRCITEQTAKLLANFEKVLLTNNEIKDEIELSKVEMIKLQSDLCEKTNLKIADLCKTINTLIGKYESSFDNDKLEGIDLKDNLQELATNLGRILENGDHLKKDIEKTNSAVLKLQSEIHDTTTHVSEDLLEKLNTLITILQSNSEERQDCPLSEYVQSEGTPSEEPVSKVQYNDAINEFERINSRLFKLRKYKKLTSLLLKFLAIGEIDHKGFFDEIKCYDTTDDIKDHMRTIYDDIQRFNLQRRSHLTKFIEQNKLHGFDIRYPLNNKFDKSLDHHFKGEDDVDGCLIIRVCKLGYYFPESTVAPYRVLSEVETE